VRRGALTLAVALVPTLASAQTIPSIFAPGEQPPPRTQRDSPKRLNLTVSVYEAVDRTTTTGERLPSGPNEFHSNMGFTSGTASLNFFNSSRGATVAAVGSTNMRHFSVLPRSFSADYYGSVQISTELSDRVRGRAAQRFSYSPFYTFGDLLQLDELDPDEVLRTDQNVMAYSTYRSRTSAGITWTPAQRSTIETGYQLEVVDTTHGADRGTLTQGGNFGFRRRMTQYADLRLGYGYRRSEVGYVTQPFQTHDINTGFSYGRPLSISRRTFVGFTTGASVVSREGNHSYYVTGSGSLNHQLARTWSTGVTYRRNVSGYAGIYDPYLVDAVNGQLTGLLSRKLSLSASGGYTMGRVAIGPANGFDSVFARGRLQFTINRYLPVYAEYVYYTYSFERPVSLLTSFPLNMTRHGVRGGLFYSVPLVGRRETS
jgi:hypothetical protein